MANKKESKKALLQKQADKDAVSFVMSRFNTSEKYVKPYFTRFQQYYALYRSSLQSGTLPWRSNLFIPKTYEIVETVAPRIAYAQRTWRILPVEGSDTKSAEAYSDLLKFQFDRTGMENILEELVKETLIYGTGVLKVSWKDNSPYPEVVDIYDFFPDPKARSDDELKYAIHRTQRDIEDLKQNPNYDKDVLKELDQAVVSPQDSEERTQVLGVVGVNAQDGTRKRFTVYEYHGLYQDELRIITVAGGRLLRNDISPYGNIPFVVVNDTHVPHELYGIGEVEPIESLQNELNDIRNQRLDNVKLGNNKMFGIVAGGVQFEDELVWQPGGIIHLNRPDGIQEIVRQPMDGSMFTEESIIKSDMERADGANSPLSGALVSPMGGSQGGSISKTATAFNQSIQQADKRFTSKVNQIKLGLIKVGRLFLQFDQKFMSKPQVIRIIGDEGEAVLSVVNPQDISKQFDLTVEIDYLDDQQRLQQDLQLVQAVANVPGFNVPKFIVDSLERNGRKDVKQYLEQPQPPKPDPAKVNIQLKGDLAPQETAQVLGEREGIQVPPEVVASAQTSQQVDQMAQLAKVHQATQPKEPTKSDNSHKQGGK